jgi:hypothetical protein
MRRSTDDARIKNDLLILARTPLVLENCLAVLRDLSATLKDRLKFVLLYMDEDRQGSGPCGSSRPSSSLKRRTAISTPPASARWSSISI